MVDYGAGRAVSHSCLTLASADQGDALGPTVLMLPGPTDSWRSYELVLERLPRGVRAISVSQRGHGESDKPDVGYGIEDFAADVVGLLDAPRIERTVLAAHSGKQSVWAAASASGDSISRSGVAAPNWQPTALP